MPFPTACSSSAGNLCLPDPGFVQRLCGGSHPDEALVLFDKGSPWLRGYARRNQEAWYASGGPSVKVELQLDEELIVLRYRDGRGHGISSSGSDGYDAIRVDGNCVSLQSDELTLRRPPVPKYALVPWKKLDERTRGLLLDAPAIRKAHDRTFKACRTGGSGCEAAEAELSAKVAAFLRSGARLPAPDGL